MKCKRCKNQVDYSRSKTLCARCLDIAKVKSRDSRIKTGLGKRRREIGLQSVSNGLCKACFVRPIYSSHSKCYCEHCFSNRRKANTEYKASHKEIEKWRSQRWRIKNPDKLKESIQKYKRNNPEKVRQFSHNNKARRRGADGKISHRDWLGIVEKFGNKCLWCEDVVSSLTRDHVVPIILGGTNTIDNIQPLCHSCNSRKHTKIIDFRPFGSAIMEWT